MIPRPHLRPVFMAAVLGTVATAALALVSGSGEPTLHPALERAIELCLSLPDGQNEILAELTRSGWSEEKDVASGENPLTLMMASTFFARQHSTSDPTVFGLSILNAVFMGGSVLGNSELARHQQPLFQFDGISLGVLGLGLASPDAPYCVFGGESEFKDTIKDRFQFVPRRYDASGQPEYGDGREFLFAETDKKSVALFYFDQTRTLDEIRDLGPIESDFAPADFDFGKYVRGLFPVTLLITSSPA